MSEMPDSKKIGSTIPALAELMRIRAKNSMAMCDKRAQVLQEQFDDAICQRDGVLEKYSAAEAKIAELTQEIAEMKEAHESCNRNMMDHVISLMESIFESNSLYDPKDEPDAFFHPLSSPRQATAKDGVGDAEITPTSNDRAIIDLFCEFIRENRAMLWAEHGGYSQGEKPPIGWVKVIGGKEFFLLPPYAFDMARRGSSKAGRKATAEALFRCGVLRGGAADGRLCMQQLVKEVGFNTRYYAISHTIFELESK